MLNIFLCISQTGNMPRHCHQIFTFDVEMIACHWQESNELIVFSTGIFFLLLFGHLKLQTGIVFSLLYTQSTGSISHTR